MTTYTGDCETDMVKRSIRHGDTFKAVLVKRLMEQFPSLKANGRAHTVFNTRLYKVLLSPFYNSAKEAYALKCLHEYENFESSRFPSLDDFWRETVKDYWVVMITVDDSDIVEVLYI